ncbi:ufm1-specific protease 2-like isoform X2 [Oscarella lobularis]|uniref:ufm1-specific protease 2-like isoform X2 n=1 Tax=Oscarella lobularis TaxID=121494 RepID=UPI00331375B3
MHVVVPSKSLFDAFRESGEPKLLFGFFAASSNKTIVLGRTALDESARKHFAHGIEPIGACLFDAECVEVEIQKRAVDLIRDCSFLPSVIVIVACSKTAENVKVYSFDAKTKSISQAELTEENISNEVATFRISAQFPVILPQKALNSHRVSLEAERLERGLRDTNTAFFFPSFDFLLLEDTCFGDAKITPSTTIQELIRTQKKGHNTDDIIDVSYLTKASLPNDDDEKLPCPSVTISKTCEDYLRLDLCVDALASSHVSSEVSSLFSLLRKCLSKGIENLLSDVKASIESGSPYVPKSWHFRPPQIHHTISVSYPQRFFSGEEAQESNLESVRRRVHQMFCLPCDRPLFRTVNALTFEKEIFDGHIVNPHIGLLSGVKEGTLSLVQGNYSYYHYLQDKFDDNGWGCAYRSLQTICSWFKHQGYANRGVPTHREIQETLVSVGDKEAKFIGSKQWIGSFEVGTCLDTLFGVTFKIMSLNQGAELENRGRELRMHFQVHGTPVMIGGGVLAHTILGVDYSDQTGQIKFLVLDPHYTGVDDVKAIQKGGWCAWKDVTFWNKYDRYNLCLPQRPKVI